jgi:LmbE family N-acetylglucosaminyl deacetylase
MATLVCFHAHPDDECIITGGVMRKAADEGHRVVLVVATRGEHGEVDDGVLAPGESLGERREQETRAAADILGASRVEFLGYTDSGMMGTPENDAPGAFWRADIDEAAGRLAAILRDVDADVLTVYDDNGGYGHPDHIQVHRVGHRAGQLAGTPRVFEVTMNRDQLRRYSEASRDEAIAAGIDAPDVTDDPEFGKPESEITASVDVSSYVEFKRLAMKAHASQISDQSFFLQLPDEPFRVVFGTEWFIRAGQGPGITETDLLHDLA